MIDLFEKITVYIIEGTCTVLSCIMKYTPVVGSEVREELKKEVPSNPRLLKFVPDIFKNQEMCINVVGTALWLMRYVLLHLRTHEMCSRVVEKYLHPMSDVPDHLKAQKMCEKAVEKNPYQLGKFADHLKTQDTCERVV